MIHSLIQQFRDRYPMGSLTADLLMLHDGQYIVRAIVQLEQGTVATGMAASSDLAQAEDLAKSRALQSLGLAAKAEVNVASPLAAADEPPASLPVTKKLAATLGKATVQSGLSQTELPTVTSLPLPDELPHPQVDPIPMSVATFQPDLPASSPLPSSTPHSAPPEASLSSVATGPVDLSDILAQTDVELRRLGWSVQQGREFLEQTYNKRSRHDLSDEELLEFLLYLEGQPSPTEPEG
ncbi:hypothetical protein [Almyronema epifaneia]|uniref:DRBM domain-containing protein n=1 Tax=Almyronema epifaneia S1 TaxID=2991925 RepID=A0ABW6IC40_9CYAN